MYTLIYRVRLEIEHKTSQWILFRMNEIKMEDIFGLIQTND